ncbi:hypothetical protein HK405_007455 [Cladochytrium tenue]|nr:hypothetical protein HK405_007455 [Cladochytrium tenue]
MAQAPQSTTRTATGVAAERSSKPYFELPLASSSSSSSRDVFRQTLAGLDAFDRHRRLVGDYLRYGGDSARDALRAATAPPQAGAGARSEVAILKEHHRFLRDDDDEDAAEATWEQRVARRYYDKLFKEFCLANLERYREGKIALRWRTQREVVDGKGQFSCGNLKCEFSEPRTQARRPSSGVVIGEVRFSSSRAGGGGGGGNRVEGAEGATPAMPPLKSWEVNFAYVEAGERRNALVKLRLCPACGVMLNYRRDRRRAKEEAAAAAAADADADREAQRRRRRRRHGSLGGSDDSGVEADEHRRRQRQKRTGHTGGAEDEAVEGPDAADEREGSPREEDVPTTAAAAKDGGRSGEYSRDDASRIWSKPLEVAEDPERSKEDEMDEFFRDLLG